MPKTQAPPQAVELRFPVGGLNKRLSYQHQSPYTTPASLNTIPDDSLLGRERGGSRPGFTSYGTLGSNPRMMDEIRYVSSGTFLSRLVAVAGGSFYRDSGVGTWSTVGSAVLATDRPLQGASFLQKFYVASNNGSSSSLFAYDPSAGTFGVVSGDDTLVEPTSYGAFSAGTLTVASGVVTFAPFSGSLNTVLPAWTGLTGVLFVGGTGYPVDTRDSDTQCTLFDLTVNAAANSAFFLQSNGPVTYGDEGATAPAPPPHCYLVTRWQNRIVMSGDNTNPLAVYFSGAGNAGDWRYALTNDQGAAVAMTAEPNSGALGDIVTALIPHNDSCIIFGMRGSISVLRGNPAGGGSMDVLSREVGVLSATSWCYDDEGFLWFMSNKGLYIMPPGCGSTPSAVSMNSLPKDLSGIDSGAYYVSMAYDGRFRGLWVVVTKISTGTNQYFFVATKTTLGGANGGAGVAAFFPQSFTFSPTIVFSRPHFTGGSNVSPVMFAATNGSVQYPNSAVKCEAASYIDIGPLPLSSPGRDGILTEVDVTLAADSDPVTVACRVGDSGEGAFNAGTFDSQVLSVDDLNPKFRPRAAGVAGILRLSAATGKTWAVESVLVKREDAGPTLYGS